MKSSLNVFASMDAAAMDAYLPSPFTKHVNGMPLYGLNRLPSTIMCSGVMLSPSRALCMDRMEALRILMPSISSGLAEATHQDRASFMMISLRRSLSRRDSCFESFSPGA